MSKELEEYRRLRDLDERIKNLPGRQMNMTLNQYINYKSPKTVSDVQQIIDDWFLPEFQDMIEIYVCQKLGPHYIGLKIVKHLPNGKMIWYPPGNKVIDVSRDILLKGKKTLLLRRNKHDGIRSVQGTDSE